MKRYLRAFAFALVMALLTGCATKADGANIGDIKVRTDKGVVEIKENLFIAQTNDIYINTDDYMDKVIKYQGFVDYYYDSTSDETYYYVIRLGPGCCGYDGSAGFEVVWDGEFPEQNEWVEVTGRLEVYETNGWEVLRLNLETIEVLDERGAEFVSM